LPNQISFLFFFLEKLFIRLINLTRSVQKICSILSRIKLILKKLIFFSIFCYLCNWNQLKFFILQKLSCHFSDQEILRSFYFLLTLFNSLKQIELDCRTRSAFYFSFWKSFSFDYSICLDLLKKLVQLFQEFSLFSKN
jgi:hypothetical protein